MYNFDLRTPDSAYDFLLTFFNMSGYEYIEELIINCGNDLEKFWDRNAARVNDISIDYIKVWAFHVVGSLDECEEIRRKGLRNLQKVLSEDTVLSRMMKSYGVVIDVKRRLLFYKGKEYNVDYDLYRHNNFLFSKEKYLEPIAHRIYYDYCVNGFMMNDDIFSYGTNIHKRPEIMLKLSSAFPDLRKMEDEWSERSKSYKVNFYATIDQIHRFNFDLSEKQEKLTDEDIEQIKRWMVRHAIDRANSDLYSEVFLYIKEDIDIPADQIYSCEEI